MIDTQGRVTKGKPRRGHETVEYARVKAHMIELMDQETPDPEIAAIIGVSRNTFWHLKKRILKEMIDTKIAERVAAREFMRLDHQMIQLVKYMDSMYELGAAPEAPYISAFTNLSKRIAELVGANAAIAYSIENVDAERADILRVHQEEMAQSLNRFYSLAERVAADGIGSGLTREERERELANMVNALGVGVVEHDETGAVVQDAEIVELDEELDEDEDEDEDEEVIELDRDPTIDDFLDTGELIDIVVGSKYDRARAIREVASGRTDAETPGRWVSGKFVSWWHDMGDNTPDDDYGDGQVEDAPADLDD